MAFPEDVLADDERIVLHLHPHWKMLFWPIVLAVFAVAAGTALVLITPWAWVQLVIFSVAFLIGVPFLLARLVKWKATHFVLTTHRVVTRSGVFSRTGRDVPLARINDVQFEHSLWERMLKCGTLIVSSASEHGQLTLRDIPGVERVQGALYQLVEQDHDRRAGWPQPDAHSASPFDPTSYYRP